VGAKTWMLVYANTKVEEALKGAPQLDRDATLQLATKLFPKDKLERQVARRRVVRFHSPESYNH
jgi:hypothetical protein